MNAAACLYFQVHQPWRLRRYTYRDAGRSHDYFDETANAGILRRVAARCYLPMNALLLDAVRAHAPHFRVAFSISGCALEQMAAWAPEALASFRALLATGAVELLCETSHHSLAALYDAAEFAAQVRRHRALCRRLLGAPGTSFRNTELIVSDAVFRQVEALGCRAICIEGASRWLQGRSMVRPYRCAAAPALCALPRHDRLSDDIAFRFSDRSAPAWPLTAPRYAEWLHAAAQDVAGPGCVGLFMDYETFGEHQWAESGIFEFMRALPGAALRRGVRFLTPGEAAANPVPAGEVELPQPLSWADRERDVSAWAGNAIQQDALHRIYALASVIRALPAGTERARIREDWRRLQSSDHFYYMATKQWSDGEVHKYFSPYDSPYAAHVRWMNVMDDLESRCARLRGAARGERAAHPAA